MKYRMLQESILKDLENEDMDTDERLRAFYDGENEGAAGAEEEGETDAPEANGENGLFGGGDSFPVGYCGKSSVFKISNNPDSGVEIEVDGQKVAIPKDKVDDVREFLNGLPEDDGGETEPFSGLEDEDGEDGEKGEEEEGKEDEYDVRRSAIDALSDDEDEAIEGYDDLVGDVDDENTKDNLMHIRDEEIAHKRYLDRAKSNPEAEYEHD